jgi:predicted nucleic acid-binding protein
MVFRTRFTALLDACVLYPVTIANLLIEFAWQEAYSARWTKHIDDEWTRSLLRDRPDISLNKVKYRLLKMHQAIPDWEIKKSSYQKLISSLQLPDPDDRHVLAAAIAGDVDFILTKNIKDFPSKTLEKYGKEQFEIAYRNAMLYGSSLPPEAWKTEEDLPPDGDLK